MTTHSKNLCDGTCAGPWSGCSSKFCAGAWPECSEIFYPGLASLWNSENMEPWSECQPEGSGMRSCEIFKLVPSLGWVQNCEGANCWSVAESSLVEDVQSYGCHLACMRCTVGTSVTMATHGHARLIVLMEDVQSCGFRPACMRCAARRTSVPTASHGHATLTNFMGMCNPMISIWPACVVQRGRPFRWPRMGMQHWLIWWCMANYMIGMICMFYL